VEMSVWQSRHRPPSRSQPRIGRLSVVRIFDAHFGQCDSPQMTDSPRGTRHTTTLRKLPTLAPNKAKHSVTKLSLSRKPMSLISGNLSSFASLSLEKEFQNEVVNGKMIPHVKTMPRTHLRQKPASQIRFSYRFNWLICSRRK